MRKILLFLILCLGLSLIYLTCIFADSGITSAPTKVTGTVNVGTMPSIDTGLLTDVINYDSVTVNPYTSVNRTYNNVKWVKIQARTGIDVRVMVGTTDTTSTTYDMCYAGDKYILDKLRTIASLKINLLGNSTTSDTGVVSLSYGQ